MSRMTRAQANVIRAFCIWTVWVWGTRIWNIWGDDARSTGFKAVHTILAVVSIAFAVGRVGHRPPLAGQAACTPRPRASLRRRGPARRRHPSAEQPAGPAALRGQPQPDRHGSRALHLARGCSRDRLGAHPGSSPAADRPGRVCPRVREHGDGGPAQGLLGRFADPGDRGPLHVLHGGFRPSAAGAAGRGARARAAVRPRAAERPAEMVVPIPPCPGCRRALLERSRLAKERALAKQG